MTSVPNTLSNGATADADEVMANFNTLSALFDSVPAASLQGGITQDQLADRFALSLTSKTVVGYAPGGDLTAGSGMTIDSTERKVDHIQPSVRENWVAYLCAIRIYVEEADSTAVVDWNLEVRKSDGTVIGGTVVVSGANDQRQYYIAKNDPVANPLEAFADGEYFEVFIWAPAGAPTPRGVTVEPLFKYALSP